ncbi:MAG: phosphoribosylamine-glycine ligase [Chitinophagaceae bacterium]|nr:phosphoribosylamine-glycine ligase [Chitinophagaceae bacterium]
MNILILGSGGREHALAWKIKQSPLCNDLFIAPGNAGTAEYGENVSLDVNDFVSQKRFCLDKNIDMIIVGPEEPLVKGVYDFFMSDTSVNHIKIIGPSATAAKLEGSKAFAKAFMHKYQVPTAAYFEFDAETYETGRKYIEMHSLPVVLKADGLAAGKGVVISETNEEALDVFKNMIIGQQFGEASARVVVEQFLKGIEVSVFVLTDGKDYQVIGHAKDYKRIGEKDTGLNTGGMGCISPVPFVDDTFMQKVEERIIQPTITGIAAEKLDYKGFVFFGLINVNGEPYVIEYNCRMGDPETEVVLPLLENDMLELFNSLYDGTLRDQKVLVSKKSCCAIVAVSGGYPGNYQKDKKITGLNEQATSFIFHSGTKKLNEEILTNGGRVLVVTSYGDSINDGVAASLKTLERIEFDGIYYRKDIGYEFA